MRINLMCRKVLYVFLSLLFTLGNAFQHVFSYSAGYKMRKVIYLFLSFFVLAFVFIKPSYAADPNDFRKDGMWERERIINDTINKSTVEVRAQRTYPVSTLGADGKPIIQQKVQKSTIKLAPKAANVGKSLIKRAPAIAITQAVVALLGKGVDWVMDAENNRVKYKKPADSSVDNSVQNQYTNDASPKIQYSSAEAACRGYVKYRNDIGADYGFVHTYDSVNIESMQCLSSWVRNGVGAPQTLLTNLYKSVNPNYDPSAPKPDEYKYIPIDQVAQKIIDQADAGEPAAMEVMSNSALDQLEAGLLNDQLEAAAESKIFNEGESDPTDPNAPNPDPDAPTDPNAPNPDAKPFELPAFCSWATVVCDYIEWTKTEYAKAKEWFTKEEPPQPDEPMPIDDNSIGIFEDKAEAGYVSFESECPADVLIPVSLMGATQTLSLSYVPFCQFASMIRYAVILGAWISALLIVSGGRSRE